VTHSKIAQDWFRRTRAFAIGGAFVLALTFLLMTFGLAPAGVAISLALFCVSLWICGVFCAHRYWNAFKDHEIRHGTTPEAARDKWRLMFPPAD
jgi:Sec-independent protein secretion pathway component TatC